MPKHIWSFGFGWYSAVLGCPRNRYLSVNCGPAHGNEEEVTQHQMIKYVLAFDLSKLKGALIESNILIYNCYIVRTALYVTGVNKLQPHTTLFNTKYIKVRYWQKNTLDSLCMKRYLDVISASTVKPRPKHTPLLSSQRCATFIQTIRNIINNKHFLDISVTRNLLVFFSGAPKQN